ncbi:PQQ-dependent sugar dehydrogenase [Chitinibacter bivalviorum]|uniref:PQQ-dependent sugar dehydrogenase n=1 Tax=Chitinibacter bivalviorum TaxID=2739434 RepID=A0A7H9BDQ8_9NEIS|nr:PQQ-dependent sugar dehydrogenase [Chitinibacter bivalviorum]QLG86843.1 PQQ-dependent sugar dehydrogenase [Chitinibacter bivalviorum]
MRLLSLIAIMLISQTVQAKSCGNLPALAAPSAAGICAGVVAEKLQMPRGIAFLPDGRVLVSEMVRWDAAVGRVSLFTPSEQGWQKSIVAQKLDRPHSMAVLANGRLLVGEVGQITLLDLANPEQRQIVAKLPKRERHPLTTFTLSGDKLYVNVGSSSNNCEEAAGQQCAEAEGSDPAGSVRQFRVKSDGQLENLGIFARGLRNSMAIAVHPNSGLVLQAENSRDGIHIPLHLANDNELPHDEINVLQQGANYGWPYCYDNARAAPEFPKYDCKTTIRPQLLLPAHVAPLGMTWWLGDSVPAALRGKLVVGFHGYRQHGQRIVLYATDARGMPTGKPKILLGPWRGEHGLAGPVEIRQASDGAVWFVDDRNGQLIRIGADQ